MEIFGEIEDPRRTEKGNLKHQFGDILFLVLTAVISGCNDWDTIEIFGKSQLSWLRKFYPYKNEIPSHDTINRVFSAIDHNLFNEKFIEWTSLICNLSQGEVVAIDGKTMRGSYDTEKGQKPFHLVSAYASKNQLCLGQVKTEEKSNEITAIPELLNLLYLKGATVTLDAMGCQKNIIKTIRKKEANYIIAVKGNQKELRDQLEKLFEKTNLMTDNQYDVGHGRVEKRMCSVITDFTFFDDYEQWLDIKSIIKIESERYDKLHKTSSHQTRYYITNLEKEAVELNRMIRDHWSIENKLHWMLDVNYQEDKSRRRNENSAVNFNIVSKIALALIDRSELKKPKRQKRFKAGFDPEYRAKILGF